MSRITATITGFDHRGLPCGLEFAKYRRVTLTRGDHTSASFGHIGVPLEYLERQAKSGLAASLIDAMEVIYE